MAGNLDFSNKRINRAIGQRVKQGEREIAKRYAHTLNEMRAMMAQLYEKYETNGVLTYSEMVKFDRLNKFFQEINHLLKVNYKDLKGIIEDVVGFSYAEAWDLTAWAIETDAKAKLGYGTATAEAIAAMLNNPVTGLTLAATLEMSRATIVHRIQQEVTVGLAKGETYKTMAGRLKEACGFDAAKAMRVVRTEGHRAQEGGKHDAVAHAHKQGVIMAKTWNSSEDERVRRTSKANHAKLNNTTIPADQDFRQGRGKGPCPGSMGAPEHDINCRCFLTYEVVNVEKVQYNELENITFEQWRKIRQGA